MSDENAENLPVATTEKDKKKKKKPNYPKMQKKFCEVYVKNGGNATAAAHKAGYSTNYDTQKLQRNDDIKAGIATLLEESIKGDIRINRAKNVENIVDIANANIGDILDGEGNINLANFHKIEKAVYSIRVTTKTTTGKDGSTEETKDVHITMHNKVHAIVAMEKIIDAREQNAYRRRLLEITKDHLKDLPKKPRLKEWANWYLTYIVPHMTDPERVIKSLTDLVMRNEQLELDRRNVVPGKVFNNVLLGTSKIVRKFLLDDTDKLKEFMESWHEMLSVEVDGVEEKEVN